MRFVVMYASTAEDYAKSHKMKLDFEEYDDFESVMAAYTMLCATRSSVLVIETENQRVVCQYLEEGHSVFNKYLLDR